MSSVESGDNRWWESYFVRYFFGWVVGCFCILLIGAKITHNELTFDAIDSILKKLKSYDSGFGYIALAATGFVFCYFSSMPIAVMHYGRYGRYWFERLVRSFWLLIPILILSTYFSFKIEWKFFIFSVISLLCYAIYDFYHKSRGDWDLVSNWFYLAVAAIFSVGFVFFYSGLSYVQILSLPVYWILIFQYVICWRLWSHGSMIVNFYAELTKARGRDGAGDVRSTYTHLREHSNAVFIVLIELSITSFFVVNYEGASRGAGKLEIPFSMAGFLLIWLIPSLFLWSAANRLESEFKRDPDKFLS
ncbi:hypothetical protein QF022_003056 [Vogesella perlucida]|nr:hypothetical protein [Vogesella perlucida]